MFHNITIFLLYFYLLNAAFVRIRELIQSIFKNLTDFNISYLNFNHKAI